MSEIEGVKSHQDLTENENPPGIEEEPMPLADAQRTLARALEYALGGRRKTEKPDPKSNER